MESCSLVKWVYRGRGVVGSKGGSFGGREGKRSRVGGGGIRGVGLAEEVDG